MTTSGMDDLTYPTPGMTREGGSPAPAGFHRLRVRVPLGRGPEVLAAAGDAVLTWRTHRGPGLSLEADAPRAAVGVRVIVRLGPVRAPCLVVWTVREAERVGFGYGTLPGHPECGEEAFLVERDADGSVHLTVLALSRPAARYARLAGPVGRLAQRLMAHRYGRAVRRAVREADPGRGPGTAP
ncbi:DUF1990 family protein [Streptomyces sp. ST2-7A]|uniref:DUF1990 family protein n=1 Tax=Streptomyces sp. ST2-7A TaxID=2907214 RepID=UPI001F40F30C|nr:DUF1990 domain-containing protein [Streptomyces sp. ST2-7A]MCE7079389.1 DUF1990 domain-containing protein [Streptomyces sp. ST2-7A]